MAAGLLARNAHRRGLTSKPWVKTSLAPGSRVVTDYLKAAGLLSELESVGFYLVGYGCTTCIGNSGPLRPEISEAVKAGDVIATSVLSGNRNFEGRVHPEVKMNFLASPPLVVAYALAGSMDIDLNNEPLGTGSDGNPVFLKDIWPSAPGDPADGCHLRHVQACSRRDTRSVFAGDENWSSIQVPKDEVYKWEPASTYVRNPPYFDGMGMTPGAVADIRGARALARAGRLGHDRPHLTGRQHLEVEPRCEVPRGAGRAARGLQFLRRPSRQPRGHDAWHLRQHPPAQPPRARHGRRRHGAHPEWRADVHLRRRDEVQG